MERIKKLGGKIISAALALVLFFQLGAPALAAYVTNEGGVVTLIDADGKKHVVDESWEEAFPYGTFALDTT